MKKYLPLLWILCVSALAQVSVVPYSNPRVQFLDASGNPLSGGKLYTCSAGLACPGNPLATYSDLGVTANANPIILDSTGSATVYLKQGSSYKFVLQNSLGVQQWSQDNITALNLLVTNPALNASQSIAGPLNLGGYGLTAGSGTFTGQLLCKTFLNISCIDPTNAQGWAGSDAGAWINAAYAALPTSGGTILVAAGSYPFSTPIVIGTANKFPTIACPASTATTFTYSGTGTAVTWNPGNAGLPSGSGIGGCKFFGPSSAGSTVGLVVGGANGAVGAHFIDIDIDNFGTGLQIGSNTQELLFDHVKIADNGKQFLYPAGLSSAGEHINFRNSTIGVTTATWSASCFQVAAGAAGLPMINVTDSNIDQCGITLGSGSNTFTNLHMENASNASFGGTAFITVTGGTTTFVNPMLIAEQANQPASMWSVTGATAVIIGADVENTGPAIANMITISGGGTASLIATRFTTGFTTLIPAGFPRLDNLATYLRGVTTPDQIVSTQTTGTAPLAIASMTPVANLNASLTTYNAAGTQQANTHAVIGSVALASATPSTATVTLAGAAVFTSGSSYKCALTNETTQANPVKITYTDGSHFTITGPNTVTDSISYSCLGN